MLMMHGTSSVRNARGGCGVYVVVVVVVVVDFGVADWIVVVKKRRERCTRAHTHHTHIYIHETRTKGGGEQGITSYTMMHRCALQNLEY